MTAMNNVERSAAVGQPRLTGQARLDEMARSRRTRKRREKIIETVLLLAACVSVFTTAGIVYILLKESWSSSATCRCGTFLTDTQWTPLFSDAHFGITVLLSGTLTSSAVALAVAIPLGTIIAIYLSEFAGHKTRETLKPLLEMLSGVPTIIYGYFALLFVTPLLQKLFPELPGFNVLSAGLVMGIMIIPYVSSLSEDAMRAVPMSLREGSYAMGATRLPDGPEGGGAGGAVGHRVGLHPGRFARGGRDHDPGRGRGHAAQPQPSTRCEPAATITSYIVQVALGDLPHGSVGYQTIFAAGLMLMLLTLFFNMLGYWIRRRYREAY
jgi:phosphate transport system permease protein